MQIIGLRMKKAREVAGKTQTDLATFFKIHRNTYTNYERAKRLPDILFLLKFCDTLNLNPTWLLTGQGPMQMPDNPAGVETKLLEKLIAKVEEHLDESDYVLSPAKKAEIISILYEEAIERDDWREQLGLDRRTKRFINLISNEEGNIMTDQCIDEKIKSMVHEAFFYDINNAVNQIIPQPQKSDGIDLKEKMIEILQEKIKSQQIIRDQTEAKYTSLIFACFALLVISILILIIPNRYSVVIGLPCAFGGIISGFTAGKMKPKIYRLDHGINATTNLFIGMIQEKINRNTRSKARELVNQELRS